MLARHCAVVDNEHPELALQQLVVGVAGAQQVERRRQCGTQLPVRKGFGQDPGDAGLAETLALDVGFDVLWWSSFTGAAAYDVVEGGVQSLAANLGDFSASTLGCTQSAVAGQQIALPAAIPALGDGLWFLVRQTGGSYDTGAASQAASRDARIAASGNDCP